MQQIHMHKAVARRVEAKNLLSRRRQSDYIVSAATKHVYYKIIAFPLKLVLCMLETLNVSLKYDITIRKWDPVFLEVAKILALSLKYVIAVKGEVQ